MALPSQGHTRRPINLKGIALVGYYNAWFAPVGAGIRQHIMTELSGADVNSNPPMFPLSASIHFWVWKSNNMSFVEFLLIAGT